MAPATKRTYRSKCQECGGSGWITNIYQKFKCDICLGKGKVNKEFVLWNQSFIKFRRDLSIKMTKQEARKTHKWLDENKQPVR